MRKIRTRSGFLDQNQPGFFSRARTALVLMGHGFVPGHLAVRGARIPIGLVSAWIEVQYAPHVISEFLAERMMQHCFWSMPDLTLLEKTADEIMGDL